MQMKLGTRVGSVSLASITPEEVERAVRLGQSDEILRNAKCFAEEERKRDEGVDKTIQTMKEICQRN